MPFNPCPRMSLQKCVKIVAMVDAVYSIIMLFLLVITAITLVKTMVWNDGQMELAPGQGLTAIFGLILLGLIFGGQLWGAGPLYHGAKQNDGSGVLIFFIVAGVYIAIFSLSFIESIREKSFGVALFFLGTLAYKIYATLIVYKFKSSVGGGAGGQERGVVYSSSATNGKF